MNFPEDNDHDGLVTDGLVTAAEIAAMKAFVEGPLVAVRNRAAGSPAVYFGPFANWEAFATWAQGVTFGVEVVRLVDPNSSPDTWWN